MFTDIVGYTALMGNDEQKEFELLKKNRGVASSNIVTTDFNPLTRSTEVRMRTVGSAHIKFAATYVPYRWHSVYSEVINQWDETHCYKMIRAYGSFKSE